MPSSSFGLRSGPEHYEGDAGRKVSAFLRPLTREAVPVGMAVVGDELDVRPALGHAPDEGEVTALRSAAL
jgi:hypothetical protein